MFAAYALIFSSGSLIFFAFLQYKWTLIPLPAFPSQVVCMLHARRLSCSDNVLEPSVAFDIEIDFKLDGQTNRHDG